MSFVPTTHPLRAAAPLALAAVALVGCDIVEGAEGHMRFDDTTLGAVGLDDNLAVGATSFVVVHCDDCTGRGSAPPPARTHRCSR